jgi:hypothetical protein
LPSARLELRRVVSRSIFLKEITYFTCKFSVRGDAFRLRIDAAARTLSSPQLKLITFI